MSKYSSMLRDPRWQKKRLKILERDGWSCQECGDESETLHVHHLVYKKGNKPWEYEDRFLVTLCAYCHEQEKESKPIFEKLLLSALAENGFMSAQIHEIACGFAFMEPFHTPEVMASIVEYMLRSPEIMSEMKERYFQHLENKNAIAAS